MTDLGTSSAPHLFDRCFIGSEAFVLREEIASDLPFLHDLSVACSPLNGVLPGAMLRQQAELQDSAHRNGYRAAMRRIALRASVPVGRIVIDWQNEAAHCVDIAVMPTEQRRGVGEAMLRAWLDTADRLQRTATLSVLRGNRAARLYARLGFVPASDDDGTRADLAMTRAPRPVTTG